tara:strand:+ start:986 stop:2254 length:1269 start_codon:yes stop_codon:yes gene_type:complete
MLQAAQVAARLGGVPYVINLAACRHHFAVGFASALKVGAITLLPPNRQPGTIVQVAGLYPGCVALCDQPLNAELLEELCKAGVPLLDITESGQGLLESATDLSSIAADQCAAIVFTSGSTGEPAAVAKPWGALTGAADLIARRFFSSHAGAVVATVPPQHMYGLETTVVMGLCGGASICATQPFFPADVQAALAAVPAPRTLVTTPVHLRALLRADLSVPQLRQVISATAPLQADQAAEAEARWDCRVMEIYGCSEAGSLASRRTVEGDFWELLDGIRLVQGGEQLQVVAPHLPGPVPLQDRLAPVDDRHFRFLGRGADMLNIAGKRASLAELTARLLAVPGVEDGVIFQRDIAKPGQQRLAALVVSARPPQEILADMAVGIDPVFLPRPLRAVESIGRNAVGKVPRAQLLAMLQRTSGGGD